MRFVIRNSDDGQFYFVLKAKNGEVIATSETYKTKQACKKGIASVMKTSPLTKVVDKTK